MGSRQGQLDAEAELLGPSWYVGSWGYPRPDSSLKLATSPYRGHPKTKPASGSAEDFIVDQVEKYRTR